MNQRSASSENRINTLELQREVIERSIDQLIKGEIHYNVLRREVCRLDETVKRMEKVLVSCKGS